MRRPALVPLLVAASLAVPLESRQGPFILSDATEPAPIKAGRAPRAGEYGPGFDALHYDIHVTLPSDGSVIEGTTDIHLARAANAPDTLSGPGRLAPEGRAVGRHSPRVVTGRRGWNGV